MKLGYGGTRSEMLRLIEDANELRRAQGETADLTIDSFADIVTAIHTVQTELGITGTSAEEASQTVEGSVNAAKAAWENLLVGFADGNQDLDELMGNFVSSVDTAMGNILPRVTQVLRSIDSEFGAAATAVEVLGVAILAIAAGGPLTKLITAFQTAQLQLALFTLENGTAALSSATMAGTLSLSEIAVGLLTGKITLATAAQAAWNVVTSAFPGALLLTAIGLLGVGIVKLINYQDEAGNSFETTSDNAEDTAQKIEELKEKIAELEAQPAGAVRDEQLRQEKETLDELQASYDAFIAQQEAAAAEAETPVAKFQSAIDAYADSATTLLDTFVETYDGIFDNVSGWFEPFETAKTTVTTSVDEMVAAMQSQIEFNNNYAANLQYLKDAGLGTLSEAFQSYGADGAAYAAAIVSALEEAGGAATTEGQAIVSNLTSMSEGVTSSQETVSASLTTMSGEFDDAISSMVDTLAEGIEGLDKNSEALASAQNTLDGYLEGLESKTPGILAAMSSLGEQITSALQASIGTVTVPVVTASYSAGGKSWANVGAFATGLDYVPYDEFPARLHKGEAVLTADEAAAWRAGKSFSGGGNQSSQGATTINQYISAVPQTPVQLAAATAAYFEQARWAI